MELQQVKLKNAKSCSVVVSLPLVCCGRRGLIQNQTQNMDRPISNLVNQFRGSKRTRDLSASCVQIVHTSLRTMEIDFSKVIYIACYAKADPFPLRSPNHAVLGMMLVVGYVIYLRSHSSKWLLYAESQANNLQQAHRSPPQ